MNSLPDSVVLAFCPGEGARDNSCSSRGGGEKLPTSVERVEVGYEHPEMTTVHVNPSNSTAEKLAENWMSEHGFRVTIDEHDNVFMWQATKSTHAGMEGKFGIDSDRVKARMVLPNQGRGKEDLKEFFGEIRVDTKINLEHPGVSDTWQKFKVENLGKLIDAGRKGTGFAKPDWKLAFDPDQPRDERGRFGSGSAGSSLSESDTGELRGYLEQQASFKAMNYAGLKDFKHKGMDDLILTDGQAFDKVHAERPDGVKKGTDKECFKNASTLALFNDKYTYVEGYALAKGVPFPIHHGWVVDKNDAVVETTWKTPGTAYIGVKLNDTFVARNQLETKMYGVFGDNMQNIKFYKEGLPDDARA